MVQCSHRQSRHCPQTSTFHRLIDTFCYNACMRDGLGYIWLAIYISTLNIHWAIAEYSQRREGKVELQISLYYLLK